MGPGEGGKVASPYPASEPVAVHNDDGADVRGPHDSPHVPITGSIHAPATADITPATMATRPATPRSRPPLRRRVSADRVRAAVFGEGLHGLHSCVTEDERLRREAMEMRARNEAETAAAAAVNAELFGDVTVDEGTVGATAWARAEHAVLDEDVLPRVVAAALVPPASIALAPAPVLATVPPAPPGAHATTAQYEPVVVGIGTRRAGMRASTTTTHTHHSPLSPHVASMDDLDEDFDSREHARVRERVRREAADAAAQMRLARYPASASAELDEERWGWGRVSPTERMVGRRAGHDDAWGMLGGGEGAAGSNSPASGDWVVDVGDTPMEVELEKAVDSADVNADADAEAPRSRGGVDEEEGEAVAEDNTGTMDANADNSGQAATTTPLSPDLPTTNNLPRTHQAYLYGAAQVRHRTPLWPLADMPRAPPEHAPPMWSALHRDAPRPQPPPAAMVNHLYASREELEALPSPRSLLVARVRRDAGAQSIGRAPRTRVAPVQRFGHGAAADAPKRRLDLQ